MPTLLLFSVKNLLNQATGAKEEYPLKETLEEIFSPKESAIHLKSPLTGDLVLRKLPEHSIGVELYDVEISVNVSCSRCLKEYGKRVVIEQYEAQFYLSPPQGREIAEQYFTIDKKKLEIDLSEIIRQILLLHFPAFPVCSKGCKGLCPHCGKNLNEETCCSVPQQEQKKENPFSVLKCHPEVASGRGATRLRRATEGSRPINTEKILKKRKKKRPLPRNVVS